MNLAHIEQLLSRNTVKLLIRHYYLKVGFISEIQAFSIAATSCEHEHENNRDSVISTPC